MSALSTNERQPQARQCERLDWERLLKITWTVIGWIVLLLGALWLLGRLWTVLLPLALGLIIVFFLRPPVEWLAARKVPRLVAVLLCYLLAVAVLVGGGVILTPVVATQAADFTSALPGYVERLQAAADRTILRYEELLPAWLLEAVSSAAESATGEVGGVASIIAGQLVAIGNRVFGIVTGLVTGTVIGFYLLYTLPAVGPGIIESMPPGWRRTAREIGARVEESVGGFLRGQLILMVIVGIMTWVGMLIIGMPYSGFIGVLAGILEFIPYLGPIAAAAVAIVIGLMTDPILALWALIVMVFIQQIESNVARPKVMGDAMGLHPVVVMLAIIGATTLFGFIGLLLSVPVLGIVKVLYGYWAERRGWSPW